MSEEGHVVAFPGEYRTPPTDASPAPAPLQPGGPGGTSGDMSDLVDAKIAAAEARTDTKFAQLLARLDKLPTTATLLATAATTIFSIIVGLIAVLAYGGDSFNTGRSIENQFSAISAKLDHLAPTPGPAPSPLSARP